MTEREIFTAALNHGDPVGRAAYLQEVCAGDDELRDRVSSLLAEHAQLGSFLEAPATARRPNSSDADTSEIAALDSPESELPLNFLLPSQQPGHLGRLGHYEVVEVIGRGGMGIVLRAVDDKLQRVVAIKVMAAQLATSAAARKRFMREAQAAAAVSHDHVVTIHAVEEAGGLPYLAMQYVSGVSLQQRLDKSGPLELREIVRIGMQMAAGLAAAHAQGLIHRDIKPANILLENGVERVKITDFGLARAVADASMTQTGMVAGTPQYMSPEQARGEVVDRRSDLFSLGSVMYAMCTGRPPFRADSGIAVLRRVCDDTPRPIRELNPDLPLWLITIVGKLQAKDPADRYQTAAEVAEVLSHHLAEVQHPSLAALAVVKKPGPVESSARLQRWAVAAAVLLCLLVGLGMAEGTGVTTLTATVIRILTPDGTLVIETNDPAVKVTVEGDGGLLITYAGAQEVRLPPGSYKVLASKDGQPVRLNQELVMITRGGRRVVSVTHEPLGAGKNGQAAVRWDETANEFSRALDLTEGSNGNADERLRILDQIVTTDEMFQRMLKLRPNVPALWHRRVNYLAEQGEWEEAAACCRTRLEVGTDGLGFWSCYAVAALAAKNPAVYREVCKEMLDMFPDNFIDNPYPQEAWFAAWGMAVAPDSVEDKQKALRVAEAAMNGLPNSPSGAWVYAAWLYRVDRLAESVACWDGAAKDDHEVVRICFLAMAHHRLGHADLAGQFAGRARKAQLPKQTIWYSRVYRQQVMREMEAVLAAPPDAAASETDDPVPGVPPSDGAAESKTDHSGPDP